MHVYLQNLNASKLDDEVDVDQETSMHAQEIKNEHDEFTYEVNRMRNSLNALTLKHFMFEHVDKNENERVSMEHKEIAMLGNSPDEKKQKEVTIAPIEIEVKKIVEKPSAPRVRFEEPKLFMKEPSRESDEIANINNELPWQKKHQYRTVTPFLKKSKEEDFQPFGPAFRPIETSRSTEDLSLEIVKPVPIFASKSYQELPNEVQFKSFDSFQTKSSDDLLFSNIDGTPKPESKRHKLMRFRSTSNSNLHRLSDQTVYENFRFEKEVPLSADSFMRKKAPQPLPRSMDDLSDGSSKKRNSRSIIYVLDKERDEFVLENAGMENNIFDEVYEDVLLRNNVTRDTDSSLFYSLVESREDCEFEICFPDSSW